MAPRQFWTATLFVLLVFLPTSTPAQTASGIDGQTKTEATTAIEIPFQLTRWNNLSVKGRLGDQHAMAFMFHTGVDSVSLTTQAVERAGLKLANQGDAESWGGRSTLRWGKVPRISIGPITFENLTVFESQKSGHGTDGKFGLPQLGTGYVEINFDQKMLVAHRKLPTKVAQWRHTDIEIQNGLMFVEATLPLGGERIKHKFMLHSGYSGFMLLDDAFIAAHPDVAKLEIIEESQLTDSAGKTLKTQKAKLPKIEMLRYQFESAPVSFFSGGIGRQKMSVLGSDFLKRFNGLFDLKNNRLYLQPNQNFRSPYFVKPVAKAAQ